MVGFAEGKHTEPRGLSANLSSLIHCVWFIAQPAFPYGTGPHVCRRQTTRAEKCRYIPWLTACQWQKNHLLGCRGAFCRSSIPTFWKFCASNFLFFYHSLWLCLLKKKFPSSFAIVYYFFAYMAHSPSFFQEILSMLLSCTVFCFFHWMIVIFFCMGHIYLLCNNVVGREIVRRS